MKRHREIKFHTIYYSFTCKAAKFLQKLVETLPNKHNLKIYFDNYFKFLELQAALLRKQIHFINTLRSNRLLYAILKSEDKITREGKGSIDFCCDNHNSISLVKWCF